jgi:hypothetical protein
MTIVRDLPPHPPAHGCEQDLGGGEEREVPLELPLHDRRVDPEIGQDVEEGLEEPVGGEACVRERDAPDHGAAHVALVPLVADQRPTIVRCPASTWHEAVDTLAGARVHLVGHRRGADLPGAEALGGEL